MMEADQAAAYMAWVGAGGVGSPPAWVFEDRSAESARQAAATLAIQQIQQAAVSNPNLAKAYDLTGTNSVVTNDQLSAPEPGRTVDEPPAPVSSATSPDTQEKPAFVAESNPVQTSSSSSSSSPTMPDIGDSSHRYVGTDARGDVYQTFDAANNRVLEWAVKVGDDSRNILPGTLRDLGAPSAGTALKPVQGDPSHTYIGTDARGDIWQLFDSAGMRILQWAVKPGDDSRNIIAGTLTDLGPPTPGTLQPAPLSQENKTLGSPGNTPANGAPGAVRTNPLPSSNNSTPNSLASTAGNAIQGDPRHKFVRRSGSLDTWQIFDGVNVIEWDVPAGSDSRDVIVGSQRNLGPPSASTVAQNDGFNPAQPPLAKVTVTPVKTVTSGAGTGAPDTSANTAPAGAGTATLIIGIAGVIINALK